MTGYDVAIVGGGQAGLALGHELADTGLNFVVLDAGLDIGHVWRDRWTSLRLFTPARYAALPGLPFPGPPDAYPGKEQVADYLATYASIFDLPVKTSTAVTTLERHDDGYRLTTTRGPLQARQVVVATGPFQQPAVPALSETFAPEILQRHSSAYRDPDPFRGSRVLVVGAGNSGVQIAAELAADPDVTAVTLSAGTRNVHVPQRILGRDIFWWQTRTGLITAPAASWRGRWMRRGEGTVIGHSPRALRRLGISFAPRLTNALDGIAAFADESRIEVDAVVWATGFRRDHSWVDIPGALDGSVPRHREGITPTPGLYVLGQPWQRTAGSALIGYVGYVGHDAAHLAQRIRSHATTTSAPLSWRDPTTRH